MKRIFSASILITAALATLLSGCANNFSYTAPLLPEAASGYTAKAGWATSRFAVAAANPLATDAGYHILKAGGSAVDAAVAVQMVLGLVEPQSSGIGGGAFLLHHDGKVTQAFDGRETAPAAVNDRLFLGADGKPMPFDEAVVGGRPVGVPGTVRMLEMAHRQHGKLPWAALFAPAIALAEGGFKVSPRLHTLLGADKYLKNDPLAAAYFYDTTGQPWPVGQVLKNPSYAAVLRRIATRGSKGLLEGEVAQAMVAKVRSHPTHPGQLSLQDLAGYTAKRREPLCFDYPVKLKIYSICGMPPPSSGAIAVGQILGILNNTNAATLKTETDLTGFSGAVPSADWLHLYTEASRLAFADRAQYVADPDFVDPPAGSWLSLLNPAYLTQRAQLIGEKSIKSAVAGVPIASGAIKTSYAPMPEQPEYGTSHISIIDGSGQALAMTTTIEDAFGSRQMVSVKPGLPGGFLLNNELTDFSFAPADDDGRAIANRVQPDKRPRSSMAPTLVFDKATGQVVMSAGSSGGAFIIHFMAKTLYGVLNWGMNAQEAINLPNFGSLNGPTLLEEKRFPASTIEALQASGHEVRELEMTSGLQAIERRSDTGTAARFFGGADPRREGVVLGD
ncbi:MAG: gamma-glutamyltransferase family protein [Burkholderiaceae bacterium]|nr:gamma-glutamyltransferase family protein [Burkholderiaceae bacterium]